MVTIVMTSRHVCVCSVLFVALSVLPSSSNQLSLASVVDKWDPALAGNHTVPADKQTAVQVAHAALEPQHGAEASSSNFWSSKGSFRDESLPSSRGSGDVLHGILGVLGLQASREPARAPARSPTEESMRRRSAKENTIPHIIHQVSSPAQRCLMPLTVANTHQCTTPAIQPVAVQDLVP